MSGRNLRAYKYFCVEVFFLISLGGAVRAMNAGLACPDWPLCFGQFIPDYHPEVYFEFIHRVLAGTVGLFSCYFTYKIWKDGSLDKTVKWIALAAFVLLLGQIVMGGLTVLWQLHEKTVTAHLAMGTGFFALNIWNYLSIRNKISQSGRSSHEAGRSGASLSTDKSAQGSRMRSDARKAFGATGIVIALIFAQIVLGGLVASHYAALVCTDFPLCHGQWIPTLRGTIGLHVLHRLGAYLLTLVILVYGIYVYKFIRDGQFRKVTAYMVSLLLVQICIGIANVILYAPAVITVLHLAVATAILGCSTYLLRRASEGF